MILDNFYVRLTVPALNCRSGAGKNFAVKNILRDKDEHLVLKEINGWGKLEDNTWIDLSFVERCIPIESNLDNKNEIKVEEETKEVQTTSIEQNEVYIVKNKESLWDIAEYFYGKGELFYLIKKKNNLTSNIISDGMELKIPKLSKKKNKEK